MEEKKVRTFEEIMKGFDRIEKMQEENAKELAEMREQQKESAKKSEMENAELRKQIGGLNKSAGMIAEEQVYNFLERTMTFGGAHFDVIQQNVHSKRALSDGGKIEAEYDVLLINDVSVCIVETKSRAREDDINDLTQDKALKFKQLFPMYANYKLYLGLGATSFEKGVKEEAKKLGIGILKPKGDFVEVYDKNLRAY
jgi:hypothetical protein